MEQYVKELQAEMNEALNRISKESANKLQKAEKSCQAVQDLLTRLKEYVIANPLNGLADEILFFKEIKPAFLSELIFRREVYYLEANLPPGPPELVTGYLTGELERIRIYFQRNLSLYNYHRAVRSDQDHLLFAKNPDPGIFVSECAVEFDPRFCTVPSFKLSKIMAFERLNKYVHRLLDPAWTEPNEEEIHEEKVAPWTDSKVSLIELAYAIHSNSSIDHGKADVKQIVAQLQRAFNVDLGNYYAVFQQNIRIRKKNRTTYLDQLRESLIRRMDDADENPKYYQ
ncbi:RteC domain-containing protein [Pedobacter sp. KR3-3]|uniref:RteC domain-containing protein n=1 Tax=Pedobacter albus TaxID=3113905 RepID=A0ABU7IAM5_9SPHI|nr:RteC domain-containing protein [Pedobacter sp. KR3-3]MEE1946414.1 RteC domain-containing protein [Pedobacter sp. KR3-3]